MNNIIWYLMFLGLSLFSQVNASIERRAAIDIGSGGTKLAIADVETETNQIIQILADKSFPVPYQAALDKSEDGTFDDETKTLGIRVFKEIKALIDNHQVQKITAIATSAFRKANNSKDFVAEVQSQTQIQIHIIPKKMREKLPFSAHWPQVHLIQRK